MKTIFTIIATLVFTFANLAFAFDPNEGGTPQKATEHFIFGVNYSGNPYNGGYFYNHPYPKNYPGNPYYPNPNCGGGYPNNPYYGNPYPGNPNPNNNPYGNPYPGNYYPNYPPNGNPYPGNPYPGNQFVNENSFNGFINALNEEAFDNNKLKMARFYASSVVLTVQQIGRILQEFTFDSNRLAFAKDAYAHCYDKYNYVLLRDKFTFSSDFGRLMEYVGH